MLEYPESSRGLQSSSQQAGPSPINDEVIADSEGEVDEEDHHPGDRGIQFANMKDIANIVSQVSASTLPGQLHGNSSISAFTAGHSQLNQISEVENFLGTASIADRAKTRQRNPKSSTKPNAMASSTDRLEKGKINGNISSDIIELSSDEDDDELNLRPSKPKPKAKPILKVKNNSGNTSNDKILDVPGTTETNTNKTPHTIPDSRPRPRPRPLVKRSKPAQESAAPPPPLPPDIPGLLSSPLASVSHGPELPIATSPVRPDLHTSQLPPSDPPLPTLTTIHDENDLPPIETLPNQDFDGPLSSPSSLFSDLGGSAKKRKRTAFNLEIDELASDLDDLGPGKAQTGAGAPYHHDDGVAPQVPPHLLPPPPTFFAGSSSSSIGGGDRRLSPQVPSELARDVVDLTMLPPTIQPVGATVSKKATKKPKISRQKKDDLTKMDEDELDNDFDPAESTKKGNTKLRPKAKKVIKAKKGKGRAQVEDPIVYKPRAQKTKEKGKGKATAGDKDTFKSREFIDDSGDDQDPIQSVPLSPVDPGKSMSSSSSIRINKKRKSVIESEPEDHTDEGEKDQQAILKRVKGKQGKKNSGNGSVKQGDTSISTSTLSKPVEKTSEVHTSPVDLSSPSNNRLNKKRSIIESNFEDEDEGENNQQAIGTSSKKKHKQGKNSGHVEDQQPAPEPEVAKETAIKSTSKVSKPDEKTNNGSALFPSLHSRYEIAPRRGFLPMSELIRRSNSALGSPFSTPQPRTSSSSSATRPIKSGSTTYSPYLKSSRSVLSRIAPLHPNRRSPPPPLPPPPPRKKTKKELEMEEKWEEEMIDGVGGISEWTCLTDDEKKELRRAKRAREMGDWDD